MKISGIARGLLPKSELTHAVHLLEKNGAEEVDIRRNGCTTKEFIVPEGSVLHHVFAGIDDPVENRVYMELFTDLQGELFARHCEPQEDPTTAVPCEGRVFLQLFNENAILATPRVDDVWWLAEIVR